MAVRKVKNRVPLRALARVASVAAGVQFGWALQLSLLTPYVQELGIPHQWASLIWLCGPISGMLVQPVVGHYSDQCTSSYGRRRPFVLIGAFLVVVAVLTIGYSADIGYLLGDDLTLASKPRAIVVFVCGFWLLDLANNTLQGPCRALLADYTGKDHRRTRRANAFYSLFMAIGNVLGYATGAYNNWGKWMGFTITRACDRPCSNLKSAFLLGTVILAITTFLSVTAAEEIPWKPENRSYVKSTPTASSPLLADKPPNGQIAEVSEAQRVELSNGQSAEAGRHSAEVVKTEDPEDDDELDSQESEALLCELVGTLRDLPRPMWYILFVTALTWLAWFPFLLFDTDWMGREVYLGEPTGVETAGVSKLYYDGVHMGSLGLMLNSIVLGITSLFIDFSCRMLGPSRVWGFANAIMAFCFASTAFITMAARNFAVEGVLAAPSSAIVVSSLAVFALLGVPQAVTYSVPYALTASYAETSGGGQGLSMGVLNLAVVFPQLVVSLGSGPFDALFGGGNLPSFWLGCASALVGAVAAVFLLPAPPATGGVLKNRLRTTPIPIP